MVTPLTDSINALTAYANETTGKSDTTLSDAVGSLVEGYGGDSSATQHTISLTLWDDTTATIPVYYDDSLLDTIITSSKPLMYNNKQIAQASLDNVSWYNPVRIPLNTQLVDFTKVKDHYSLDNSTGEETEYQWSSITDYILIDPDATFSYLNYRWYGLYFYDTNKDYIEHFSPDNDPSGTLENDIVRGTLNCKNIPSNATYMRFVTNLTPDDTRVSLIRTA